EIDLGQDDIPADLRISSIGQNILETAFSLPYPFGWQVPVEFSILIYDARLEQFSHDIDEAGTANSGRLRSADGEDHRLKGGGVDTYFFYGSPAGTHAKLDTPSFKGGTGRAGGTGEPIFIAHNQLAICPYIHK